MEALYARYPFLEGARSAVESADVDLAALVSEGGSVTDRALERVRLAIEEGTTGAAHRSERVELLSYPVSRVIVSLVDMPGLVHRYARAEADTARDRFVADFEDGNELKSVGREGITLERLLSEFDLARSVRPGVRDAVETGANASRELDEQPTFLVEVGVYLRLTEDLSESRWKLSTRALSDGTVLISREELHSLLREAVRRRIESKLPLSVPDPIGESLADELTTLRSLLAEHDHDWDIDRVDPEAFPPCIDALLERASQSDALPAHSQFTLISFLATTGMETSEIVSRLAGDDTDSDRLADRISLLRDGDSPSAYPPPSCEAMVAYGDCVNKDDLCERIAHPLTYYERRLAGETAR